MVGCRRCGLEFLQEDSAEKYLIEKRAIICFDCKRVPVKTIRYLIDGVPDYCRPWSGDFDSDDYPINKAGEKFTGEEALCGHRDCINAAHRPSMVSARGQRSRPYRASRLQRAWSTEVLIAVSESRGQL